jgi:hypothetical protein
VNDKLLPQFPERVTIVDKIIVHEKLALHADFQWLGL